MLRLWPCTLEEADEMVKLWHRHHKAAKFHRWSHGLKNNGIPCGAAIVGRPKARNTPQYTVAEVTRLVTDGTKNACSMLYSAAARAADSKGYDLIQTFILASESGTSLYAAGWVRDEHEDGSPVLTDGGTWNRPSRGGRRDDQPQEPKQRFYRILTNGRTSQSIGEEGSRDEASDADSLLARSEHRRLR